MNFEIPEEIVEVSKNHPYTKDTVSFASTKNGGAESVYENNICYSTVMSQLMECDIRCFPEQVGTGRAPSVLPPEMYKQWMELCIKHHWLPPNTTFQIEERNHTCLIPCAGMTRHEMYAALCCYRWSQNQPRIPWMILKLMEQFPKIHFYQAVQYTHSLYVEDPVHSFLAFHNASRNKLVPGIQYQVSNMNLLLSVVAKWFFAKDDAGNSPAKAAAQSYTITELESYLKKLGFTPPEVGAPTETEATKRFHTKTVEDILWDGWAELFEVKPDKTAIEETFDKLAKVREAA